MKRKMRYTICVIVFVFCFILDVEAKNIVKQCKYESSITSLTLNLYDNKSSKSIITKFDGKGKSNDESVQNWKDYIKTSSASECPKKVLVTKGTFGFNVYVGANDEELNSAANNKLDNAFYLNYIDTIATCSYDLKINGASNPFTISVGKHGSLNYSILPSEYFDASNGVSYFVNYNNMDEFKEELYHNKVLSSTCPKLSVGIDYDNTIWIYNGKSMSTSSLDDTKLYANIQSLKGTFERKDTSVEVDTKKEKEYCSLPKKVTASSTPINIRFYDDVNGNHMFEVSQYDNANINTSARYDGIVSLSLAGGHYTIQMDDDWDNVSSYWSNNCSDTPIYLYTPDGDPKIFYVTSKEVDPLNNASNLGEEDDGKPYVGDDDDEPESPSTEPGGSPNTEIPITDVSTEGLCRSENLKEPLRYIGWILTGAKIIIPAIIIIFGVIDFFKLIVSSKPEEIQKAVQALMMRVIAGIIIFFLPAIINFLFTLVDDFNDYKSSYSECTKCLVDPTSC